MDFGAFLDEIRSSPDYAGQICYVREQPAREARFAEPRVPLPPPIRQMLLSRGIERLYAHQAQALDAAAEGKNLLLVTGTASGKSLCYTVPILQALLADPGGRFLLVFPTKALCQDQFKSFSAALAAAGMGDVLAGVFDGDTPDTTRRKLRDEAAVIFTNPDMLHAAIMPSHGRWASFLGRLRLMVLDELHTYSGLFGSNMANLLRRFGRVCEHYKGSGFGVQGSDKKSVLNPEPRTLNPLLIACSATIGNPAELAERLTGRQFEVIDDDGSPRGRRTYVFWNPPRVRGTPVRSRRSANVEAHELMALLIQHGAATITFSKAKMTAEMIHRYVTEKLAQVAPQLASKVTPYRGGYLPEERRDIEKRLFSGELMGVSTTNALELGIDVGGLDASIIVGYPGTLASFLQQTGRAGRRERDSLAVLVGLDTTVNQYVMQHPQYIFGRPVEQAALDPDNPFVITGHLRCAAHEMPLPDAESAVFGPHAPLVLRILEENRKVKHLDGRWWHAAAETPQHEFSLRSGSDANVIIQDADTGAALGEVDKFDAPPILHPEAIYMHRGDTYRVLALDLDRNLATVKKEEVDYYTQPWGGTDVHHIDHALLEKPLGTRGGKAFWGEVTSQFANYAYEKIRFYTLDAISVHGVTLPHFSLETMAFWIVPPEDLMEKLRRRGLDAFAGLRGIGYATRMLLPLFITCDTLDFSHTVGAVNAPWNAIFIYERYPHGLGFTEKAYHRLHEIMPAVLEAIRKCPCPDGCPCCVGKPLRGYTVWNVERGEGSVPSKAAAMAILEGLRMEDRELRIEDGAPLHPPSSILNPLPPDPGEVTRLEQALRRRLERGREPQVAHAIEPVPPTEYPKIESAGALEQADVARRAERRQNFERDLRRRLAGRLAKKPAPSIGGLADPAPLPATPRPATEAPPIQAGDSLAASARRLKKRP